MVNLLLILRWLFCVVPEYFDESVVKERFLRAVSKLRLCVARKGNEGRLRVALPANLFQKQNTSVFLMSTMLFDVFAQKNFVKPN